MITWIVVLSAGLGMGLWALAVWLVPPRPPLADLISRLRAAPTPPPLLPATVGESGFAVRLGRNFTPLLRSLGLPRPQLAKDLAITGQTADTYLTEKAALTVTGLLIPTLVGAAAALSGNPLPWQLPAVAALACAAGGFLLPDVMVRAEAKRRRADFRHALSAYLNLIHILLAGGAGVDGALDDAAEIGRDWTFQHLRRALTTARLTRTSPWSALGRLGDELGVVELTELAAALTLAGTEGARVRASLAAKAAALRSRSAADSEAKANAATERMVLPGVLMAVGFVLFVFYPALQSVTFAG